MKITARQLACLIREAISTQPIVVDADRIAQRPYSGRSAARASYVNDLVEDWIHKFGATSFIGSDMIRGGFIMYVDDVPSEKAIDTFMKKYPRVTGWELAIDGSIANINPMGGGAGGGPAIIVNVQ